MGKSEAVFDSIGRHNKPLERSISEMPEPLIKCYRWIRDVLTKGHDENSMLDESASRDLYVQWQSKKEYGLCVAK